VIEKCSIQFDILMEINTKFARLLNVTRSYRRLVNWFFNSISCELNIPREYACAVVFCCYFAFVAKNY